jgi:hypothetical protein
VVTFWAYLRFQVLLWVLRTTGRVLKWAITAAVLTGPHLAALALAPVQDWEHAWHLAQDGRGLTAFVLCAPVGVPAGATIRAVGHRWHPVLSVPYAAMGRHQVVIGASGSRDGDSLNRHPAARRTYLLRSRIRCRACRRRMCGSDPALQPLLQRPAARLPRVLLLPAQPRQPPPRGRGPRPPAPHLCAGRRAAGRHPPVLR